MEQAKNLKELKVDIGVEVLATRTRAGMTQHVLAKKIGTPQPNISAIESGNRMPSISLLFKIAEATGSALNIEITNQTLN